MKKFKNNLSIVKHTYPGRNFKNISSRAIFEKKFAQAIKKLRNFSIIKDTEISEISQDIDNSYNVWEQFRKRSLYLINFLLNKTNKKKFVITKADYINNLGQFEVTFNNFDLVDLVRAVEFIVKQKNIYCIENCLFDMVDNHNFLCTAFYLIPKDKNKEIILIDDFKICLLDEVAEYKLSKSDVIHVYMNEIIENLVHKLHNYDFNDYCKFELIMIPFNDED